ncbi:hypothetical protein BH10ACI2_BH10ACI2_19160 [soil metagenome]
MKIKKYELFGTKPTKSGILVITDVVQILTDTTNPSDYLKKIRKRDAQLSEGWGQIVTPLLMETAGGKQNLNCSNAKGLLRIIQSIPSPNP